MDGMIKDLHLQRRTSLWVALSEFYIDTELSKDDLIRIARIFKNSEYELIVIKEIDLFEVFPALQYNLLSPVPDWAGFDESCLVDKC